MKPITISTITIMIIPNDRARANKVVYGSSVGGHQLGQDRPLTLDRSMALHELIPSVV